MALYAALPAIPPPPVAYLRPLPNSTPLTPVAAALPPFLYYLALLLLPPFPSNPHKLLLDLLRNGLAISAGVLFFHLPLRYHVPFSVGLTYQLALVGLYGGCRVLDAVSHNKCGTLQS